SFNKMQHQLLTTQTQLIESEKLASVGKLADEIANDINNPLTGIIIHSESLIKDADNEKDKKIDLETIRTEALKIRESIRNILSLTRKEKPDFNRIDISRVITHAISVVEKFSNFQNIKIITGIPKKLPEISADPNLLEQVFLDLLLIFSELMPSGGILNISASYIDDKKETEIVFTNTGKAISQDIVQKVFSPINTLNQGNFAKAEISLTVCKDIIEMHKGEIIVNPNGNGNSIVIRLPV
ncbi:MAG: histidine kinase dimerization/phospho-acceptor domain-containing protein, partial [Ignavibacteriaceae bacterium]